MYTKIISFILAFALLSSPSYAAESQLLQRDIIVYGDTATTVGAAPQIIPQASAGSYSAATAQSNMFSGWRLLALSVLCSSIGGFMLWRFVSREADLMQRN